MFDDADVDAAVEGTVVAKMRNIGETCTAANRFQVGGWPREQLTEKLGARLAALPVGRGTEDEVRVGPLIDDRERQTVDELVRDTLARGATAVLGGGRRDDTGDFYEPTVLGDVPAGVLGEEILGPVAPVTGFQDGRRRSRRPTPPSRRKISRNSSFSVNG